MAKVIPLGQPENESERMAIDYLRGHLPEDYTLLTNLELQQGIDIFEIDLIMVAPHCVYVVDIKNWHGIIEVTGASWNPEHYQSYPSPLKNLRKHAKVLSSLISDKNHALRDQLRAIHIQATILMTAEDVEVIDPDGRDGPHVTYLDKRCLDYFRSQTCIPSHRLTNIKSYESIVRQAIEGKTRGKSKTRRYRDWQVEDKLGGNDRYTEYRARKTTLGVSGCTARLRVYQVDPFLEPLARETEYKRISTAFQAVYQLPRHDNILAVQDFFASEDHDCLVLVAEDIPAQVLRQFIKHNKGGLDQALNVMRDVLHGLEHAHKHGVIHRNLTPDTILITEAGQAKLTGFDYARISARSGTIADDIAEDLEADAVYQAIECQHDPSQASLRSDLFSIGLVFYELLTGIPAFQSAQQIYDCEANFPHKPSSCKDYIPSSLDSWLQKLCAFDPADRFPTADAALQDLAKIATSSTLDFTTLTPGILLGDRYQIIDRLGHPGSFAATYKVMDTWAKSTLVMKLVLRDRRSVYERLLQEYRALKQLPPHPYIVKVIHAEKLKDDTPYLLFEYVDGEDVRQLIDRSALTLEQALQIARETAEGLVHLHQHKIYHQDIKPSNLFLTAQGIRIIDFNAAISESFETTISAGTRPYLPPDFKPHVDLSVDEKVDRDLYALGITLYECLTLQHPFQGLQPPLGQRPPNLRQFERCADLSDDLVRCVMQMLSPCRADRFSSAEALFSCLASVPLLQPAPLPPPNVILPLSPEQEVQNPVVTNPPENSPPSRSVPQPVLGKLNPFEAPVGIISVAPDPDRPIVLDPTGIYPIPTSYTPITTEVEWMADFGRSQAPYWVKGKRLCVWAEEWLRVWNKTSLIAEQKTSPRHRLELIFDPISVPQNWTEEEILNLLSHLDVYPKEHPIAYLLADLTNKDTAFWLGEPSREHLAQWLTIQVPPQCQPIEQVWQHSISQKSSNLAPYYKTNDKLTLLRNWVGITEHAIEELERYPLPIPEFLQQEFASYWEHKLLRTEAKVLDKLHPTGQVGMPEIANQAYQIFKDNPSLITAERSQLFYSYLTHSQQIELDNLFPPNLPTLLPISATPKEAMNWVTEQYLPFRRWEVVYAKKATSEQKSEHLADSFVSWILENYPRLIAMPIDTVPLNYNVASLVRHLSQDQSVLWVVVDGLGWLDHQELLSYLKKEGLMVEASLEPRLSILPTKTEYAKWSLYTQKLPNASAGENDLGKSFSKVFGQERYTDRGTGKLRRDLSAEPIVPKIYCWDTTEFDHLCHDARDWEHFYSVQRSSCLEQIARSIVSFVKLYPEPSKLSVVIASDHGQVMGVSQELKYEQSTNEPGSRALRGKIQDSRFIVLEADRYGLPEDFSVIRGSECLKAFNQTLDGGFIGSHGGLLPEEVVVGVSVLRLSQTVKRKPVIVVCEGEGETDKPTTLTLTITNPNSLALTDLRLVIPELPELKSGKRLEGKIPANQNQFKLKVNIPCVPELPISSDSNRLALSGRLDFQFADAEASTANLEKDSYIRIHRMFRSGFANFDLNDF